MKASPKRFKMPLFCLLFVILFPGYMFSQAWNPFPGGGTYLYSFTQQGSPDTWLHGVRIDSLGLAGNDSVYYFNKINRLTIINEVVNGCQGPTTLPFRSYLVGQDNNFGDHMVIRPGGDFEFVGTAGDTFLLRTQVVPGSNWTFTPGDTATLDSIGVNNILGQIDSVMYISLSSNHSIALSRNHGFMNAPSFLPFVDLTQQFATVDYSLWGIPDRGLGDTLPGEAGVMDIEVGDRLGYHILYWKGQILPDEEFIHDEVLSIVNAQDSTVFNLLRENKYEKFVYLNPYIITYTPPYFANKTYLHDSIPELNLLPYESDTGWAQTGVFLNPKYAGRPTYVQFKKYYFEPCVPAVYAFVESRVQHFTAGLGKTWDNYVDGNADNHVEEWLYCYRKQTDSLDVCEDLNPPTAIDIQSLGDQVELLAYPSPATTLLRIQVKGNRGTDSARLLVYDLHGQKVGDYTLASGETEAEVDVRSLAAGMYSLSLQGENGLLARKKFVVQK